MILASAEEQFVAGGLGLSLRQVASAAGVAQATLYRHFANRETLEREVFERRAGTYTRAIVDARSVDDPGEAFRGTVHAVARLQSQDRFFREYIRTKLADPGADTAVVAFHAELVAAIDAGHDAGALRAEVDPLDVMVLLEMIGAVARPIAELSPDGLARAVDLLLDGICTERRAPAGEPLTQDELLKVIRD